MNFLDSKLIPQFTEFINQRTLWVPVLSDRKKHWAVNQVSFVYFYGLERFDEWIVGIHHNDCHSFQISFLSDLVGKGNYVYQKKYLSDCAQDYEAQLAFWFESNERLDKELEIPVTIRQFWNWYPHQQNLNDCIPIMKWLEYCREIKDKFVLSCQNHKIDNAFVQYNQLVTNLANIERSGLNDEHCEYNPYTLTGRPSNHFNNINYAALNKTDGSRKRFVSRFGNNGCLIEIDLTGFHLYLIYLILNKPFPKNIYEELGKSYFKKVQLTEEEIKQSKDLTFRQIYGGIEQEYQHIEPFNEIHELTKQLYESYKRNDLKTLLFNKKVDTKRLIGFNQSKIFNYLLQNLETEFNGQLINDLVNLTKSTKSKFILYTYDSFLIDYCFEDGKHFLQALKDIFKQIPYHLKVGTNYHDLKQIL